MKNFFILFVPICIIAGASYYLYEDYQKKPRNVETAQGLVLGQVVQSLNIVKRKASHDPYWYNVSENEVLYDKDLIKTGVDSYAQLALSNQGYIEVDENSLIAIEKQQNAFTIDFKVGEFTTKDNQANLAIKINETVVQANAANLTVRKDRELGTSIQVQEGKVNVIDKDKKNLSIDKSKQISIDPQGKVKAMETVVLLSSPEHLSRIKDPRNQIRYPFTWAVLREDIKREFLQISSSPKFEPALTREVSAHQATDAVVKKGVNYWRVGWQDKGGRRYSPIRKFFLETDESIRLLEPKENARFDFLPGEQEMIFKWESKIPAKIFMLEIASDPNFRNMVRNQKTEDNLVKIKALDSAGYYWRVRAFDASNKQIGMSPAKSFNLRNVVPKLPKLIEPVAGLKWTIDEPIALRWEPMPSAKNYSMKIAKGRDFSLVVKQQTLNKSSYLWQWQEPGEYHWQVIAYDSAGAQIGKSLIEKFVIAPALKKDSLIIVAPKMKEVLAREKGPEMKPIVLQWKPSVSLPPNYRVRISETADMSAPVAEENVRGLRYLFRPERAGTFFWQVEWIKDGKANYFSPIGVFQMRYSSSMPAPELLLPVDKSVFYTGKVLPVDFEWSALPAAAEYVFSLYEYDAASDKTNLLREEKTQELRLRIEDLKPASYVWRVRGVDADGFNGSAAKAFRFLIKERESLGAPKLRPAVVK